MELILQLLVGAVITTAVYLFVAVGFSLIFAVSRMFHFAHAPIYALSGYVTYSVSQVAGLVVGILVGVAASVVAAVGCEVLVYRTMRRHRASHATLLIASLGLQLLLQGGISSFWSTEPRYLANPLPNRPLTFGPISLTPLELCTVVAAAVVVGATLAFLAWSRAGRALLAVAEEPDMAQVVGISEPRVRMLAFAVGTAIACPAAIMVGLRSGLTPDMGNVPLLFAFAAVVVGGIGSIRGTALGLLLLMLVSGLTVYKLPTYWMQGIAFVILLGFMLWRPRGLLGSAQRASAAR